MFKFNNGLKLIAVLLLSVIFSFAGCSAPPAELSAQKAPLENQPPAILDVTIDKPGGEISKSVTFDVTDKPNGTPVIKSVVVEWPSPQKVTIDPIAEEKDGKETIIQTRSWGVVGIECVASDPDGNPLVYSWTATGGKITGSSKLVSWVAPGVPGNYAVTVKVSDSQGGSTQATVKFYVKCCP